MLEKALFLKQNLRRQLPKKALYGMLLNEPNPLFYGFHN